MESKELIQALRSDAEWVPNTLEDHLDAAANALDALLAEVERLNSEMQLENTQPESDGKCREDDGCPTENAVLRREWRKLTEQLAITTNIPIDRLEAICAAEKDGRLVTLPCKVGDTAFIIPGSFIIGLKVISILVTVRGTVFLEFNSTTFPNARATDVGKTVFLTRAEAETALKESNSTSLKLGAENG